MFQGYSLINIIPSAVVLLAINCFCFFFCFQGYPNLSRTLKDTKAMKKQRKTTEVPLQASKFNILTFGIYSEEYRKDMETLHYWATSYHSHCTLSTCSVNKTLHYGDMEYFNNFKAITCLVLKDNSFFCKVSGGERDMQFIWSNYKHLKMTVLQLLEGLGVTGSDLRI